MTDLQTWMERARESDASLAEKTGVSRVQISRVRRRICAPSLSLAARLEEITGIPAASFARSALRPDDTEGAPA